MITASQKILTVAIENIKERFLRYRESFATVTTDLFESSNFPKVRRYTLGDHSL